MRHTAISEAVRLVQQNGMDLTSILKFSRHSNMTTLQFYLDQESRLQGKIADLVAAACPNKRAKACQGGSLCGG